MRKMVCEIIANNLFFKLQEGEVDCDCDNFYCFKALDEDNFYFGYYHRTHDGRWEANDGAYDLSVTETTPAQLSVVDEFDLDECATAEEATQRFLNYFETLYQRDFPTLRLSECVENGGASLMQLKVFVGDRIGKLWAGQGAVAEPRTQKRMEQAGELPAEVLELMGCANAEHFVEAYGSLEDGYFDHLITALKTLHDRKKIADDYIDKLLRDKKRIDGVDEFGEAN